MKLLFKRSQALSTFRGPHFQLWAKVEFDENEKELVKQYRFNRVTLIEANQPRLLRNSALVGAAAFLVCTFLLWNYGAHLAMPVGLLFACAAAWLFFDRMRETIAVIDLMHGRYFTCGSVIDLARKEAWLGVVTSFLRQVLESAKHWDGTEARPIEALSAEEAKYVVIRGL